MTTHTQTIGALEKELHNADAFEEILHWLSEVYVGIDSVLF